MGISAVGMGLISEALRSLSTRITPTNETVALVSKGRDTNATVQKRGNALLTNPPYVAEPDWLKN